MVGWRSAFASSRSRSRSGVIELVGAVELAGLCELAGLAELAELAALAELREAAGMCESLGLVMTGHLFSRAELLAAGLCHHNHIFRTHVRPIWVMLAGGWLLVGSGWHDVHSWHDLEGQTGVPCCKVGFWSRLSVASVLPRFGVNRGLVRFGVKPGRVLRCFWGQRCSVHC